MEAVCHPNSQRRVTATMEKGKQGKSVQCGDTVKGEHKVDMDTLVDTEMSTKGPG